MKGTLLTLKFTPPKNTARYAVAQGRRFKTYDRIGSAKIAAGNLWMGSENAYLLEFVEDGWYVLYTIPAGTKQMPWVETWTRRDRRWQLYEYTGARPMSRDAYVDWRLRVERERTASQPAKRFADGGFIRGSEINTSATHPTYTTVIH